MKMKKRADKIGVGTTILVGLALVASLVCNTILCAQLSNRQADNDNYNAQFADLSRQLEGAAGQKTESSLQLLALESQLAELENQLLDLENPPKLEPVNLMDFAFNESLDYWAAEEIPGTRGRLVLWPNAWQHQLETQLEPHEWVATDRSIRSDYDIPMLPVEYRNPPVIII